MSTIEKLSISGIRSFGPNTEQEIKFQKPLTVICGANGTGKSTIIECLKFATTGELPPGLGISAASFVFDPNLIEQAQVQASIKLLIKNKARKPTVVARLLKNVRNGRKIISKSEDGTIKHKQGDEMVAQSFKKQDMDKAVPELLGVSAAILNHVIFCHQEESNWPLNDNAEVKKRFDEIFESSRYTEALKEMRKTKKELETKAKVAEAQLKHETDKLNRATGLRATKTSVDGQVEDVSKQLNQVNAELQNLAVELGEVAEHVAKHEKTAKRMAELESVVAERTKNIAAEQAELEASKDLLTVKSAEELESAKTRAAEVTAQREAAVVEREALLKTLDGERRALTKARDDLLEKTHRLKLRQEDVARLRREAEQLGKRCKATYPELVDHVQNYTAAQIGSKLSAAVQASSAAFDALKAELDKALAGKNRELDDVKTRFLTAGAKVAQLESTERAKKQLLDKLAADLAALPGAGASSSAGGGGGNAAAELTRHKSSADALAKAYEASSRQLESHATSDAEEEQRARREMAEVQQTMDADAVLVSTLERQSDLNVRVKAKLDEIDAKADNVRLRLSAVHAAFATAMPSPGDAALFKAAVDALAKPGAATANREPKRARVSVVHVAAAPVRALLDRVADELATRTQARTAEAAQRRMAESAVNEAKGKKRMIEDDLERQNREAEALQNALPKAEFWEAFVLAERDANAADKRAELVAVESALQAQLDREKQAPTEARSLGKVYARFIGELNGLPQQCPLCHSACTGSQHRATRTGVVRGADGAVLFAADEGKTYSNVEAVKARCAENVLTMEARIAGAVDKLAQAKRVLDNFKKHVPTYLQLLDVEKSQNETVARLETVSLELNRLGAETSKTNARSHEADVKVAECDALHKMLADVDRLLGEAADLDRDVQAETRSLKFDATVSLADVRARLHAAGARLQSLRDARDAAARKRDERAREHAQLMAQLDHARQMQQRLQEQARERTELASKHAAAEQEWLQINQDLRAEAQAQEPLKAQLRTKTQDRDAMLANHQRELDEKRRAVDGIERDFKQLTALLEQLAKAQAESSDAAAEAHRLAAEANRLALEQVETRASEAQAKIAEDRKAVHDIRSSLVPRINRNMGLLKLRAGLAEAVAEQARLEKDSGGGGNVPFSTMAKRARVLQGEVSAKQTLQSRLEGSLEATRRQQEHLASQLAPLERVDKEHAKALVEHTTLVMASRDLTKFHKALDQALMKFHSMKIDEINKRIKELWQVIYRGKDIDLVELRAEPKETASETAASKQYSYRVVMRKNVQGARAADLDMRGRCSAGQKVLACIVIRMALAESFSLNCGVLALDEPTTNLDEANKEGLAQALADLIKSRGNQENFELIIITHDEEFVDMLHKSSDGVAKTQSFFKLRRVQDPDLGAYVTKIEALDFGEA